MSEMLDVAVKLSLEIAQALTDEFGVGIDAQPGGDQIEAGTVNRAFQVMVRTIVAYAVLEADHSAIVITNLLREAALRRLLGLGVQPEQAEVLVSSEPQLGDSWLAYLALAPNSVIDDLTR